MNLFLYTDSPVLQQPVDYVTSHRKFPAKQPAFGTFLFFQASRYRFEDLTEIFAKVSRIISVNRLLKNVKSVNSLDETSF